MADLSFEIVSPEKLLAQDTAQMIVVPGTDGDFAVLEGHAPFMSTMRPGAIDIYGDDDSTVTQRLFVKGGLAQIAPAGLTILAEEALDLDSVDVESVKQAVANLHEDLAGADDEPSRERVQSEIDWRQTLLEIAS